MTRNMVSMVQTLALPYYASRWSKSIQAVIMKYHTPGGLNNGNLFFTVLKTEKSKTKVSTDLVSCEVHGS